MNDNEKNPNLVLDAITDSPKEFSSFKLNDLTILRYAWLEKLHSPFIDSSKDFSIENIAPTVFVLAADKKELRKYSKDLDALELDALEWADEHLTIDEMPQVIKAVVDMFTSLNKAAPSASSGDTKKN